MILHMRLVPHSLPCPSAWHLADLDHSSDRLQWRAQATGFGMGEELDGESSIEEVNISRFFGFRFRVGIAMFCFLTSSVFASH